MHIYRVSLQPGLLVLSIVVPFHDKHMTGSVKIFREGNIIVFPSKWCPLSIEDVQGIVSIATTYFQTGVIPQKAIEFYQNG